MRTTLPCTILAAAAIAVCASSVRAEKKLADLYHAIGQVESNNRDDGPDGDNGKAIGRYQIWEVYWKDAVEFDKKLGGKYQDCRKKEYAERVMHAYWRRYCPEALKNLEFETLARIHNGGPRGHKKQATLGYWKKVQKHLH